MSTPSNAFSFPKDIIIIYKLPTGKFQGGCTMHKYKKFVALLIVSLMVFGSLSACGSGSKGTTEANTDAAETDQETTSGEATGVTSEKITLTTVSMMGGTDPNTERYQEVIDAFMEKYPNVTVEDSSQMSDQTWKAKVAAQFSVGDEPDVIQFFTDNNASEVLAADQFVTIDEIREVYPEYAAAIVDNAWKASANPDGVNRAVPTTGFWEGLFCNKDLFDKYELALPTDWDSFITAVKTFKENGIIPIAVSLNEVPHYWIEHLMLSAAGGEEFTSVPETAPESWIKGLEILKELYEMGAFPEDSQTITNDAAGELFKTKQAAMQLDGSWYAGGIDDQENTVVVAFPVVEGGQKGPNDIIGGLSSGFYITKKAWDDPLKRAAAVEFVMMNTSPEQIAIYWNGNGMATVELEAPADMTPLGLAGLELGNAATGTFAPTDARLIGEAYSSITTSTVDLVNGTKTAEEILNNALQINMDSQE